MNYIYLPDTDYNYNAIDFYITIFEDALKSKGLLVKRTATYGEFKKGDIVYVTHARDFCRVFFHTKGLKIYSWFQGVVPEEIYFKNPSFKGWISKMRWSIMEFLNLKFCDYNFFVSEAMIRHYKKKYGYNKNNYIIMPCFNQDLDEKAFNDKKYSKPSFVYSGSLAKWQCFERTVDTFKIIRQQIPEATLSVFTGEVKTAKKILMEKGLIDVDVRNIPYQQLSKEMNKFKYGFLLRDDIIVNNVATPTKMSSYIGCGIIPVFSSYIGDFEKIFGKLKYVVCADDPKVILEKIQIIEASVLDANIVYSEYEKIFESYYNRKQYIENIKRII